ncbi:hypothetical protein [Arenicella xantha]|uniref:Uncharacterized protein n=1 Tax=Arenicella xantha TaxID=644221 RepID=A0A395JM82_9GAMM|nr:hypothetical protein [Arenicella xantha]RBP52751.1 hypothetical protein DFR28_101134 [Arenicella xantha]
MQSIYKIYNLTHAVVVTLALCLLPLLASAQNQEARRLCTEAAQGLLPEDAPAYIANCVSDYNVNMGVEADTRMDRNTVDDEFISDADLTDNDQVGNGDDGAIDSGIDSGSDSSESYQEDDPQSQD